MGIQVLLVIDFKLLYLFIGLLVVEVASEIHLFVIAPGGCWPLQLMQLVIVTKQEIAVVLISHRVELVKLKLLIEILDVHNLLKIIFGLGLTLRSLGLVEVPVFAEVLSLGIHEVVLLRSDLLAVLLLSVG